jgi:hypothetical protein
MGRFPADDPAHRRIMAKTLGVIHVLVTREPSEHGLPQHSHQRVSSIPAGACVGENFGRHRGKTEGVIELPIREQPGVRGHHRSAKLEHHPAVEIKPESPIVRFTRRVRHQGTLHVRRSPCKI